MKRTFIIFINIMIFVGGCIATFISTDDLRLHAKRVVAHLGSGTWDVQTDRPAIEEYIRNNYKDMADRWKIFFVGGSGNSYSLAKDSIRYTVNDIGHRTIADGGSLSFNLTPVYSAYGHLLSQLIYSIEPPREDARAQDALRELALAVERRIRSPDQNIEKSSMQRVNSILAKIPNTNNLKEALALFEEHSKARGVAFPRFLVGTKPSFDGAKEWDESAVVLPQSVRCIGKVQALGENEDSISSDITHSPRLLEVEFNRPWLSDALLNETAQDERTRIRDHFLTGGDLSIVPSRIWVLMPEQISFQLTERIDEPKLKRWIDDNICCNVTCGSETINIRTDRISSVGRSWRSTRSDEQPLLFAIVARTRRYQ